MKTYVINMLKDTHKRACMEQQLSCHPFFEYEFIRAVEGNSLSEAQISEMANIDFLNNKYGSLVTPPAIGCSLSHLKAYSEIIEKNVQLAVILEDDALINRDSGKYIEILKEQVFNVNKPIVVLLTPVLAYNVHHSLLQIDDKHKVYPIVGGWMASGYMLNKQAAIILKRELYPVKYVADDWREFKKMGISIYGIVPHITSYKTGKGEIGNSILAEKQSFIDYIKNMRGMIIGYLKGERLSKQIW